MNISSDTIDWLRWVSKTSTPLYKVDKQMNPIAFASGCLVNIGSRKLLLSVSHSTRSGQWIAEIRYDPSRDETIIHPLGELWTVQHHREDNSLLEELDISFVEVPDSFHPVMQEFSSPGTVLHEWPRHEFIETSQGVPCIDEIYAFSGCVLPEQLNDLTYLLQPTVYPGLKYICSEGDYLVFKLPVDHPGHEKFSGCSGAPIVDRKHKIVALVCSGNMESNTIRGIATQNIIESIRAHFTRKCDESLGE